VLTELGLTADELTSLTTEGVVGIPGGKTY
jgi:hypothetical protein